MAAEVICVGTELLLGDILNSNSQYLAKELAELGVPHFYQTVVGDNIDRVHQAIEIAANRSSILIFTGGLGPTPDDLTTESISSYFNTPLVEHSEVIADIQQKFAQSGRVMTPSNRKQALQPAGADLLPNPAGTAPGMIWQPRAGLTIFTFPGVPREMQRMWRDTAVPFLKTQGYGQSTIYSRSLRFFGIPEAALAEKVNHLFNSANPTVAPYAGKGEVRLRISARAANEAEANALIEPIAQEIKQIAGVHYYGEDEDTLASVVGGLLKAKGQTLSVAESCTGGGLGQMLTDIPGSSEYFMGGVISYANRVKIDLLDVNAEDLAAEGAVSEIVARQMAAGVKTKLRTDWGVSITGVAGPGGGTDTKPVGLVYIGIASPNGNVEGIKYQLSSQRERELIRRMSASQGLNLLRQRLQIGD
ncbi:competence/damage-inducible protein A [Chamaesiphon minutus]|uniref:CinA-like protein n=1 Tax=Chamaesiphon minutus (strain ATCC 27169 / PCC 6605) TaxID=1173020 RepID=K9UM26_CHAP6|nr:competence/damage-inducible protein A [Chamaesiphon minutus]AFY96167.1 competence/damage-inducible protein CinA-like protein [Chamaesiphon minutus PCC 6605]